MSVDFTTNNEWLKASKRESVNWGLLRRFAGNLRLHRSALAVALLVALVMAALNLAIPEIFRYFQEAFNEENFRLLVVAVLGYGALLQTQAGLSYVFGRLRAAVYTRLSQDVLVRYYRDLLNVPAHDFLAFRRSTNMFQRVIDAMDVSGQFVDITINGAKNLLLMLGVGVVVYLISPPVLVALLLGAAALGLYVYSIGPTLRTYRQQKLGANYPLVSKMLEVIDGLLTVKALSGTVDVTSDVSTLVRQRRAADFNEEEYRARINAVAEGIRLATLTAAMAVGFWMLWTDRLPLSDLFAIYILVNAFLTPASMLLNSYKELTALSVNLEKYYEVVDLNATPALPAPGGPSSAANVAGAGEERAGAPPTVLGDGAAGTPPAAAFTASSTAATRTANGTASDVWLGCRDVTFGYDDTPVLNDLSFTVDRGEHVALIGRSGVGKTTVMRLLLGFLRPDTGAAWVGGERVTGDDATEDFRSRLGVVSQDDFLFNVNLRHNLLFGMTDFRSDAEIEAVLREVGLWDVVRRLDDGLDTVFHTGTFSGGQVQRLLVARAMIRRPEVILLDEPTSSLDFESEQAVLDALDRLTEGRTTLTIAHRLTTVQSADRVLVMDDGHIVDTGPHDALMQRSDYYRDLCEYNSFIT